MGGEDHDDPTCYGSTEGFTPERKATPRLLVTRGSRVASVELGTDPLTIGRYRTCDLVLDSQMVSREHARVVFDAGSFVIQDLDSRNGVLVNGRRLARNGRRGLEHGDRIQLSDCELVFCGARADAPPKKRFSTIMIDRAEVERAADEALREFDDKPE